MKELENKEIEWSAKRELAKVNYHIHTNSIKENLIVPELSKEQIYFTYASEADLLNVALFGITASEWRRDNEELKGNIGNQIKNNFINEIKIIICIVNVFV